MKNSAMKKISLLGLISLLAPFTLNTTISYADGPNTITAINAPEPPPIAIQAKTMPAPTAKGVFKNRDKNGNGKISFEEFYQFDKLQNKQRAEKEIKRMMSQCDKNNDGIISKDELTSEDDMEKYLDPIAYDDFDESERFNKLNKRCMFPQEAMDFLDVDGNGSVSREEMMLSVSNKRPSKKMERKLENRMQAREAKRKKKEFTTCDSNADQLLSLREIVSMKCSIHLFTEQFDAHDTNKDDYLSVEELTAKIKEIKFKRPGLPSEAERRKKMPPLMRLESSLYECDKDEDGRLSKNETIEAQCEQDMVYFDTVDHNQDGYVSQEELQRMRLKERFDRMDKNNNGFLEKAEFGRLPGSFIR